MSIISAHSLTMEFLDSLLFDKADFDVEEHDKVGLIGANGAGKTTLFKLITGALEPSDGNIFLSSNAVMGVIEQHACSDFSKTAREEMLSVFTFLEDMERELEELHRLIDAQPKNMAELIERQASLTEKFQAEGGLTFRSRSEAMLSGLGFTQGEAELSVGELSGGQRTKISLGKLLLSKANLILLDEPTNHLDIKSTEWLEDFLSKYSGTALIISHDRYFLDKTTNKTMEIEHRKITVRKGNYSTFRKLKEEQLETLRREYEQQTKEIRRIEGIIQQQKQFNQARNYVTIASKQKQIDRLKEDLVKPESDLSSIKIRFEAHSVSGNDVLMVEDFSKSYGDKVLFRDVSLNIYRGERVFLLGSNGCGKSTFLKALLGKITPDRGYCRFGANVEIGYFDQIQAGLSSQKTIIDEVYDKFPSHSVPELRSYLGGFCFSGEDIYKKMCELSGGERARVALLELMLKKPNFLILDEPTNHLDMASEEVLENALKDYEGTVFCVSHDRFLVNKLATKILILNNGTLTSFDGSYDEYAQGLSAPGAEKKAEKKPSEYKLRKEREAAERKRISRIKRLEADIEDIEARRDETAALIETPEIAADYQRLVELTAELDALTKEQEALYEEWLELSSRDNIQNM